jgi:hypothetical protein
MTRPLLWHCCKRRRPHRPVAAGDKRSVKTRRRFSIQVAVVRVIAPDGSSINLGGPKPKTVLVRLALDVGDVVSADNLVDTLWGERPPRTARRSLQAHVAKLRAALGADDGPLSSSGSGYVLDVARENVDVLRIEDRLRAARELATVDQAHARGGENYVSIGFTGSGELILSAESSSVVIPTDPDKWIAHACTLLESLSPSHPLDERLAAFEQGCS